MDNRPWTLLNNKPLGKFGFSRVFFADLAASSNDRDLISLYQIYFYLKNLALS